jgi:hypothetical protein
MRNKTFYRILVLVGFALWLGETAYFGYNDTPQSGLEKMLDIISQAAIFWGILGDLLTGLKISKHEHHITNAKKLNYIDQRTNGKTVVGTKK